MDRIDDEALATDEEAGAFFDPEDDDLDDQSDDVLPELADGEDSDDAEDDDLPDGAILDLSTLAPLRPQVRIKTEADPEGKMYEMATPDEIGAIGQQQVFAYGRMIDRLMSRKQLSEKQKQSLELAIRKAARIVLPAELDGQPNVPDEVFDELPDDHRRAVVDGFFVVYADNRSAYIKRLIRRTQALQGLMSES